MNKGNYFFLGIGISYLIVAIIQMIVPGALSAVVFVTVAFISLELTMLEFFKILSENLLKINREMICTAKERCFEIESILSIIEKNSKLEEDVRKLKEEEAYMTDLIKKQEQSKTVTFVKKIRSLLFALQIIMCMVQIIVTPLKIIPYDTITTKMINILTLITFSIMFFSYFVSNKMNDKYELTSAKLLVNKNTTEYYLNLLKKIHK